MEGFYFKPKMTFDEFMDSHKLFYNCYELKYAMDKVKQYRLVFNENNYKLCPRCAATSFRIDINFGLN